MSFAKLYQCNQTPKSIVFDDIYFSSTDGIGESQYHFLEGNNLTRRFSEHLSNMQTSNKKFVVAETGFGTGLNFLLAANLWKSTLQTCTTKDACLQYISIEKYPIEATQLQSIYLNQHWESDFTQQLIESYPKTSEDNRYDIYFKESSSNIQLTLLIGDAVQQLANNSFKADAWFLDGFAPNKNPDMWSEEIFKLIANHSLKNTTFATFTAASIVRKRLLASGFEVEKTKGFGNKRERLVGYYSGDEVGKKNINKT